MKRWQQRRGAEREVPWLMRRLSSSSLRSSCARGRTIEVRRRSLKLRPARHRPSAGGSSGRRRSIPPHHKTSLSAGERQAARPFVSATSSRFPWSRAICSTKWTRSSGLQGAVEPFDFTDGEFVTADGRDAIRGKNTWMPGARATRSSGTGCSSTATGWRTSSFSEFARARHTLCEVGADQPAGHEGPARKGQEDPRPLPRPGGWRSGRAQAARHRN